MDDEIMAAVRGFDGSPKAKMKVFAHTLWLAIERMEDPAAQEKARKEYADDCITFGKAFDVEIGGFRLR